jgi:hypothetical protein
VTVAAAALKSFQSAVAAVLQKMMVNHRREMRRYHLAAQKGKDQAPPKRKNQIGQHKYIMTTLKKLLDHIMFIVGERDHLKLLLQYTRHGLCHQTT